MAKRKDSNVATIQKLSLDSLEMFGVQDERKSNKKGQLLQVINSSHLGELLLKGKVANLLCGSARALVQHVETNVARHVKLQKQLARPLSQLQRRSSRLEIEMDMPAFPSFSGPRPAVVFKGRKASTSFFLM